MSARSIKGKQAKRMRKALRVTPPRFLDLVQWLKDRRHAQTTGEAHRIILAGRVRHGSHKVGVVKANVKLPGGEMGTEDAVYPFVPSEWRGELIVVK